MFGEKVEEFSVKQGKNIPVWQSPKYVQAKEKAIEIIESKKYDLTEADFWILMNETKTGKMGYSGLIISHNGCLKINDKIESSLKFDPSCVTTDKDGYKNALVVTYINKEQGIYEVGEVTDKNCKNDYPYAMAVKRCMDRVILKNCRLAYNGVYSDSEAEEFEKREETTEEKPRKITKEEGDVLYNTLAGLGYTEEQLKKSLAKYKVEKIDDLNTAQYGEILQKVNASKNTKD